MWTMTICTCIFFALRRLVAWTSSSWGWRSGRRLDQGSNLFHPRILVFLLCGKLVVDVVPFPCFKEMNVDGEVLDALSHSWMCALHLSLLIEDWCFGDVVVHAVVVVVDRRGNALPIHHKTRANMSGRKRRTYTNVPWPKLTMNQVHSNADNEIALLVLILVGSHTYTSKAYGGARWG